MWCAPAFLFEEVLLKRQTQSVEQSIGLHFIAFNDLVNQTRRNNFEMQI